MNQTHLILYLISLMILEFNSLSSLEEYKYLLIINEFNFDLKTWNIVHTWTTLMILSSCLSILFEALILQSLFKVLAWKRLTSTFCKILILCFHVSCISERLSKHSQCLVL